MPRTRTGTPPKYRQHKARNLAKVSISRRDIYLGPYNSPESHQRYAQVIAAWQAGRTADEIEAIVKGTAMPEPDSIIGTAATITVGQLAKRFWAEHAATYYTSSTGLSRGRTANVKVALRAVNDLFAALPAAEFGPLHFQHVRQSLVDRGLSRRYVNDNMRLVVALFSWGVSQQLVSALVPAALREVRPLRKGKSSARETDPVRPAERSAVERTLPHLTSLRPGWSAQTRRAIPSTFFRSDATNNPLT